MRALTRTLLLLPVLATVDGCARLPPSAAQVPAEAADPALPVAPEPPRTRYTVAWLAAARGGAAWRPAGYAHVLATGAPPASADAPAEAGPAPTGTAGELAPAWQRYCDGGFDLSAADWEVVRTASVPAALRATCRPPK